MTEARSPRSRFYDGSLYAGIMDRFTSGLHGFVAKEVGETERVLDVGCGTGSVVFRLAPQAKEVVGVELSPAMVAYANERRGEGDFEHVSFVLGDASTALAQRRDHHFDVATMVLVLHEMPHEARAPVLREAARVAKRVLCVDFRVPMPLNVAGLRNRFFEAMAGWEHFQAFRDFNARGGTRGIAESAGLTCRHLRYVDAQSLEVCEIIR